MRTPFERGAMSALIRQTSRYGLVGIYSNVVLYILYLGLTALGLGHKLAMTLVFATGVSITYHLNKNWSFGSAAHEDFLFAKYAAVYGAAYLLNLTSLWLLVDLWQFPHQLVQAAMIVVCAGVIFLLLKLWLFRR